MNTPDTQLGIVETAKRFAGVAAAAALGIIATNIPSAHADVSQDPVNPYGQDTDQPVVHGQGTGSNEDSRDNSEKEATYEAQGISEAERLAGETRIQTAIAVSEFLAPNGDNSVVVFGNAYVPFDILAGTGVGVQFGTAALLTEPDSLNPDSLAEANRSTANRITEEKKAILLGGTAALSSNVEAQLQAEGFITIRVAGENRFGTAVAISNKFMGDARYLILVNGRNPIEAMIGGSAAAVSTRRDMPPGEAALYLTDGDKLPPETLYAINSHQFDKIFTIGSAPAQAYPSGEHILGSNPSELSINVARTFPEYEGGWLSFASSNERSWPDGLNAGILASFSHAGNLIVVGRDDTGPAVDSFLSEVNENIHRAFINGGTAAISTITEQKINDGLNSGKSKTLYTVKQGEAALYQKAA